jgi:hypothetical protein
MEQGMNSRRKPGIPRTGVARISTNPIHTAEIKAKIRSTLVAAGLSQHKFGVWAGVNPQTLTRYIHGSTWSATTERKLERALVRLPKRKSTKHRRINLEERPNGKA